jgi:SET domain-containing protein
MTEPLPHCGVHARLGSSSIHGIGVFAMEPIKVGTNVFENDRRSLRWIDVDALETLSLSPAERKLYGDFGVRRDGQIGCPENFNLLSVGWYVNEPLPGEEPNLRATEQLDMMAARDIAAGEELTIDYTLFSEPQPVAV